MQRFRVDLETINEPTLHHPLASYAGTDWRHPVLFRVVLYKGYAKSVESVSLPPARLVSLLSEAVKQHLSMSDVLADYVVDVPDSFEEDIPDATTLQAMRAYRGDEDDPVEFAWLDRIQGLVDSHLPEARYSTTSTHHPLLLGGTDLPIRTLSKALAASYIATKLNRCVGWIKTHPGQAFIPKGIDLSSSISEISSSLRCRDCIDERFRTLSENLSSADASSSKSAVVKMAPS